MGGLVGCVILGEASESSKKGRGTALLLPLQQRFPILAEDRRVSDFLVQVPAEQDAVLDLLHRQPFARIQYNICTTSARNSFVGAIDGCP